MLGPDPWTAWSPLSVRRMRDACLKLLYDRVGKAVADEERKLVEQQVVKKLEDETEQRRRQANQAQASGMDVDAPAATSPSSTTSSSSHSADLSDPDIQFPRVPSSIPLTSNVGSQRALLANLWAMQDLYLELLEMVKPVLGITASVDSHSKAR